MNLILASQSPRRRELLGLIKRPFAGCVPAVDETMDPMDTPETAVAKVSARKAMATPRQQTDTVVAADTIVVCDGKILGKPENEDHARKMLTMLSGRAHQVMTGLTVLRGERSVTVTEITQVHFRELSGPEIDSYIRTGEPMDKAGAYGIQGGAALFVTGIEGDYFNVVGLPVCRLGQILRSLEESQ